ncbi:17578_t:CDS:2 [Acaulospora colombiana]|uniref:17578_t:CDS:1 n=1 Tax=Acaulospora colombiana TaxID=27376 RepID=A0ACA9MFK5_9GLOM|nr:17578_t:CDS:2 [Acaulospora colombiana]
MTIDHKVGFKGDLFLVVLMGIRRERWEEAKLRQTYNLQKLTGVQGVSTQSKSGLDLYQRLATNGYFDVYFHENHQRYYLKHGQVWMKDFSDLERP